MRVSGVVGFAGPRFGPASSAAGLVSALVGSVLASGRSVASGCAVGVDALAVSAAVAAGAGSRLSVFAAFGPAGLGALPGSSAPPSSLVPVVRAGGRVVWWAGGGPVGGVVPSPARRLVGRSLAFVRSLAAGGPGSGLVLVVSGAPPRPFAVSAAGGWPAWPSCGSGSWGSAGAAALLGVPVVVFPSGWPGFAGVSSLPALPGRPGRWVSLSSSVGVWSAGFAWRAA